MGVNTGPKTFTSFKRAIAKSAEARGVTSNFLERTIGNLIFLQMLSRVDSKNAFGYVKGGTAVTLRFGLPVSRMTKDLDLGSRLSSNLTSELIYQLNGASWNDFNLGAPVLIKTPSPSGVRVEYLVDEYRVKLKFRDTDWISIRLESSTNEFELDQDLSKLVLEGDLLNVFNEIELPKPEPVPLISAELQVAQKLHALTQPDSQRGHDMHDILLYVNEPNFNFSLLKEFTARTFTIRNTHALSLNFQTSLDLRARYENAIRDLGNSVDFELAVEEIAKLIDTLNQ